MIHNMTIIKLLEQVKRSEVKASRRAAINKWYGAVVQESFHIGERVAFTKMKAKLKKILKESAAP